MRARLSGLRIPVVLCSIASLCAPALTLAQPAPSAEGAQQSPEAAQQRRAEAAERFDRALKLFEEGNNASALAEFRRVQEISPNPIVLYNIGLVSAAMGRAVDAVDALTEVLKNPEALGPARAARARVALTEQSTRIALLDVSVNTEVARIEVDGVEAGRAPLSAPLRVTSGSHLVGAVAEGYVPERREVLVAGGAITPLRFELVEMRGRRLANLSLRTNVLAAEVVIDGAVVARTPLAATLALAPGQHRIELRRAGYQPRAQTLELGDGATGELTWPLEIDPAALTSQGADVTLEISEPGAQLSVDGVSSGLYAGPLRLPVGPHHVRVERAGFLSWERVIQVDPHKPNGVNVELEPTPQTRAEVARNAHQHRLWGIVGVAGGAVIAGLGTGWLLHNGARKSDARQAVDAINAEASSDSGRCDTSSGAVTQEQCNASVDAAYSEWNSVKKRDVYGWIGVGVGAAALTTGI
ncbi:MAG TPA: PEGA domain-containing protein, partial [Polyangiaceae bacterium]|nr:PEGA domain-containing protein [Polyangiaceae bacterium]